MRCAMAKLGYVRDVNCAMWSAQNQHNFQTFHIGTYAGIVVYFDIPQTDCVRCERNSQKFRQEENKRPIEAMKQQPKIQNKMSNIRMFNESK